MKRTIKKKVDKKRKKDRQRKYLMMGLLALGFFLIVIGALASRQAAVVSGGGNLSNRQLIAMGEEVYGTYCAACHGVNLEGQPDWQRPFPDGSFKAPPHDETGHTWHHNDTYLIESIKLGGARLAPEIGVSLMPAYAEILTDQQILAVLAYIKNSWPPDILAAQSSR